MNKKITSAKTALSSLPKAKNPLKASPESSKMFKMRQAETRTQQQGTFTPQSSNPNPTTQNPVARPLQSRVASAPSRPSSSRLGNPSGTRDSLYRLKPIPAHASSRTVNLSALHAMRSELEQGLQAVKQQKEMSKESTSSQVVTKGTAIPSRIPVPKSSTSTKEETQARAEASSATQNPATKPLQSKVASPPLRPSSTGLGNPSGVRASLYRLKPIPADASTRAISLRALHAMRSALEEGLQEVKQQKEMSKESTSSQVVTKKSAIPSRIPLPKSSTSTKEETQARAEATPTTQKPATKPLASRVTSTPLRPSSTGLDNPSGVRDSLYRLKPVPPNASNRTINLRALHTMRSELEQSLKEVKQQKERSKESTSSQVVTKGTAIAGRIPIPKSSTSTKEAQVGEEAQVVPRATRSMSEPSNPSTFVREGFGRIPLRRDPKKPRSLSLNVNTKWKTPAKSTPSAKLTLLSTDLSEDSGESSDA